MAKIFLSLFIAVFFTMVSPSFAASVLNIEIETGAMRDAAKAVKKSTESLIFIADPVGAKFLFTAEPGSLAIYDTAPNSNFFMVTGVGDQIVEISAENLGEGDFVVVNTAEPDGCTTLTFSECRAQSDFIAEQSLSIKFSSPIPEKVEVPVPATESSLLDQALGFFLGLIGVDDTATSTDTVTTETTNTDSLANVISAIDDASATPQDSSTTTSAEEQTDTVIVSDTNAPSITSPMPDETATSTVPEAQSATSSVTGDTNTNGTTTATF